LHHGIIPIKAEIAELAEADQEVDDQAKYGHGVIVSSHRAKVAKTVAQSILEIEPLKKKLKDEESGEGGQALVFESQLRDGVGFALDLVSAKLHKERLRGLFLVP
jgi:hypothetical protein